jgi:hypothetical protein
MHTLDNDYNGLEPLPAKSESILCCSPHVWNNRNILNGLCEFSGHLTRLHIKCPIFSGLRARAVNPYI